LILLIFVLVIGAFTQRPNLTPVDTVFEIVVLLLVMVEFAVVRLQDYVLASLIGVFCSLVAPTRPTSSTLALLIVVG